MAAVICRLLRCLAYLSLNSFPASTSISLSYLNLPTIFAGLRKEGPSQPTRSGLALFLAAGAAPKHDGMFRPYQLHHIIEISHCACLISRSMADSVACRQNHMLYVAYLSLRCSSTIMTKTSDTLADGRQIVEQNIAASPRPDCDDYFDQTAL